MRKKYMYLLVSIIGIVITIGFINARRLTNKLDNVLKRNDNLYMESLSLIASAMNFNYADLTEEDRLQHYTGIYEKIGVAESVYPYTSYCNKNDNYTLELAMNELKEYFHNQWLSNFEQYNQTQIDAYNLVLNMSLNPEKDESIYNLYDFLIQYNK